MSSFYLSSLFSFMSFLSQSDYGYNFSHIGLRKKKFLITGITSGSGERKKKKK